MTREEEIKEQSTKYMWNQRKSHFEGYDIEYAFRAGAQWADEHPKDNLVDIGKVYKFIDNKIYSYVEFSALGVCVDTDMLISDLRKAMKGE